MDKQHVVRQLMQAVTVHTAPPARVRAVQFDLLSEEEVARRSVVTVRHVEPTVSRLAPPFSVLDPRMGSPDPHRIPCHTCYQPYTHCNGHEGDLVLPFPIYSAVYFKQTVDLLRCVCYFCSRILALPEEKDAELNAVVPLGEKNVERARFTFITEYMKRKKSKRKVRVCPHCCMPQPQLRSSTRPTMAIDAIFRESDYEYLDALREGEGEEDKEEGASDGRVVPDEHVYAMMRAPLNQVRVRAILAAIPAEDLRYMGINHDHVAEMVPIRLPVVSMNIRQVMMLNLNGAKARTTDSMTSGYATMAKLADQAWKWVHKAFPQGHAGSFQPVQLEREGKRRRGGKQEPSLLMLHSSVLDRLPLDAAAMDRFLAVEARKKQDDRLWEKIQQVYGVMTVNDNKTVVKERMHNGQETPSIRSKLCGKTNLVRGQMLSKRVNYCMRTTIGGNVEALLLHECGLPRVAANDLTKPVRVTEWNRADLAARVARGYGVNHGAAVVDVAEGARLHLKRLSKEGREEVARFLRVGHVVHRHLVDGDIVILNRQPSLHRPSMMAHRVRIINSHTLIINTDTAAPYNADFDGDDMNVHVPQDLEAEAEAQELMGVWAQMLSVSRNSPCMGATQDTLTGMFCLTRRDTFFNKEQFAQLYCRLRAGVTAPFPRPAIFAKCRGARHGRRFVPVWTGKQVASLAMAGTRLNLVKVASRSVEAEWEAKLWADDVTIVRDGALLAGQLDKATIGKGSNLSLHHMLALYDRDPLAASNFLSNLQVLAVAFLGTQGFSVRLQDVTVPPDVQQQVQAELQFGDEVTREIYALAESLRIPPTDAVVETSVERVIAAMKSNVTKLTLHAVDTDGENHALAMVRCGAKGDDANIVQITSMVGQQRRGGARLSIDKHGGRLLTCFPYGVRTLDTQGFVKRGFMSREGLTPAETLLHCIGGREGVVDSSTMTADTGYLQRKLGKTMEGCRAATAGTIVSEAFVVEYHYGGDGCDPSRLQAVPFSFVCVPDALFWERLPPRIAQRMVAARQEVVYQYCGQLHTEAPEKIRLPIEYRCVSRMVADITAEDRQGPLASPEDWEAAMRPFATALRPHMSDVALAQLLLYLFYHLCKEGEGCTAAVLRKTFAAAEEQVMRALVSSGEAVGIVAAQSIGEMLTQNNLNVFKNICKDDGHQEQLFTSAGVSRIKELIDMSTPRYPVMRIAVRGSVKPRHLQQVAGVALSAIKSDCFVVYDPVTKTAPYTTIEEDAHVVENIVAAYGGEASVAPARAATTASAAAAADNGRNKALPRRVTFQEDAEEEEGVLHASPYVLRVVLNRAVSVQHNIAPVHVARALERWKPRGTHATVLFSERKEAHWVVRLRLWSERKDALDEKAINLLKTQLLRCVVVGGVGDVTYAFASEYTVPDLDTASGRWVQHRRPCVYTQGSALAAVANMQWVDWENTISFDLVETYKELGVDAANTLLTYELDKALNGGAMNVDIRHMQLLADVMTMRGTLMRANRHGLATLETGPIQKSSFENQFTALAEAGLLGLRDNCDSVTQSVIFGQRMPFGTGAFGLLVPYEGELEPQRSKQAFGHLVTTNVRQEYVMQRARQELQSAAAQARTVAQQKKRKRLHKLLATDLDKTPLVTRLVEGDDTKGSKRRKGNSSGEEAASVTNEGLAPEMPFCPPTPPPST